MASLREIKKRISSVQSTKQITRTMEMVAAAKIRRSTERIAAATPYSDSMTEVLASVAEHAATLEHPLLAVREDEKRVLAISVVSDRGLAGGFNANVLRETERYIKEKQSAGVEVDLIACGKKALAYFNYRGLKPVMVFRDLSADPTMAEAREIAQYVIDRYSSEELDEVTIIYNHARNSADQDLRSERILPIETSSLSGGSDDEGPTASYEYEPSAEAVLIELLPAYIMTSVYHALIDSAAGEQGARRKAMQAATDSATDMVNTLTRSYNRARQGAITTEISEIVGGASALED